MSQHRSLAPHPERPERRSHQGSRPGERFGSQADTGVITSHPDPNQPHADSGARRTDRKGDPGAERLQLQPLKESAKEASGPEGKGWNKAPDHAPGSAETSG